MFTMWISLGIIVVILVVVVSRKRTAKIIPPEYPGGLPFIGHGYLFATTPFLDILKNIATTAMAWGGVVQFRLGPTLTYYNKPYLANMSMGGCDPRSDTYLVQRISLAFQRGNVAGILGTFEPVISDPQDSLIIANACLEKDYIYDFMKPALGEGLVTGKVSTWRVHRKLLMPAFNQVVLDGFIGLFNSQSKRLIDAFSQISEGTFDCHALVDRNALETICLTAMGGSDANDIFNEDYLTEKFIAEDIVAQRFQKIWLHSDFMFNWSSLKKIFIDAIKIMHNGSNSVIQKKRNERKTSVHSESEKSSQKFKAFIDLIMELSGEKGLTDQEIREEVDTIILAGHETTALSITYTLVLLGSHPDVQEQVFKEISEVVGERDVEKQDLKKLVYLDAVLKESLRLFPIAPFIARKTTHDVKLTNYTLPAGSGVYLSIWALNHHASMGADPEKFVPGRWVDGTVSDQATYAPFSIGKRNCIGKTYAMMSMKTTLVHLVRNFRFKADVSKIKLKVDILMKPVSGHEISMEKRK